MSGSNITYSAALFAPFDDLPADAEPREVYSTVAQVMGGAVLAERVLLLPARQLLKANHKIIEWSQPDALIGRRGASAPKSAAADAETLELALALQEHARRVAQTITLDSPADMARYTGRIPTNGLASERCLARTISHRGTALSTAIVFRASASPHWSSDDTAAFDEVCRRAAPIIGAVAGDSVTHEQPTVAAKPVVRVASERDGSTESRLERLIDQSDAVLFHTNADHVITFISGRSTDFFGIPPEDFTSSIEVRWYELVHLDDRHAVTERMQAYIDAPKSF